MQSYGGQIVYSATDLNNFLACAYLTTLDLDAVREGLPRPQTADEAALLGRLGEQHEQRYLGQLRSLNFDIAEIDPKAPLEIAARATLAAMRSGREVIYQATFLNGEWMGRADFLRKVVHQNGQHGSAWPWHYEVEDAKLALHTQPYFLLQLCYYSEHVARIQGVDPEGMHVILGDETRHRFRYAEFSAYYRAVKVAFVKRLEGGTAATYPLPVEHCELCVWRPGCDERWQTDDHLKLVANITRLQIARLNAAGITTLAQLGTVGPDERPQNIERATFDKLSRQARLQLAQRKAEAAGAHEPAPPEFLPHDDVEWRKKGFALLPAPSPQDVFFDMEGDPYYDVVASLEYLFGIYTPDDGAFRAFWGCDRSVEPRNDRLAEKRAFERFIDFVMERYRRFPDMHIYHYASYEKTKLQELSQRHATREDEVTTILRNDLLVDLYRVVRQSIAVGQPGYSIKLLELYYGKRDVVPIKTGGQSILYFEQWLASRYDARTRNEAILEELETYNKFDCVSTYGLREWLLTLRERLQRARHLDIPYFSGPQEEPATERADAHQELKDRLKACIPEDFDPEQNDPRFDDVRPLWMALEMLEYHWREDKPVYWLFHDRCATHQEDPQDLIDDSESLVHLEFVDREPVGGQSKSVYERYRYPLQEFKLDSGACFAPHLKKEVGAIVRVEEGDEWGTITILRAPRHLAREITNAIVVRNIVQAKSIRAALARFSESLLDDNCRNKFSAAFDILTNGIPRFKSGTRPRLQPEIPEETSIQPLLNDLDNSYLFIQGPPGSGKTYTGARLIASLLQEGLRIGISANSHKAIHNLLAEIEGVAHERNTPFLGIKKISKDNSESEYGSPCGYIVNADSFESDEAQLFAGTAWAICPAFVDNPLDYLFIDEAGQVALPHAIAMSTKAKNVVLLGDPLQLPQVAHTSHPGGVGNSVLQHLIGDELRPVAPDRGILLTQSYRMNGPICRFVSEMMYLSGQLKMYQVWAVESVPARAS